jgi:hypothetical protein
MISYVLPRRLTVPAWEERLGSGESLLDQQGNWSERVRADGFLLDFTGVEFVDFPALARPLILLDAAARDDIRAGVALPTAAPSAAERSCLAAEEQTEEVDAVRARFNRQARRRQDARAFMRQTGFEDALRPSHWPADAVSISEAGDQPANTTARVPGTGDPAQPQAAPYNRRRILPFQWIPDSQLSSGDADLLPAIVQALRDIGLSLADARAVGQEVIAELLRNITAHAGGDRPPPCALIGAALTEADTYAAHGGDRSPRFGELTVCATSTKSRVLQIVVADSGIGLAAGMSQQNGNPKASQQADERTTLDTSDTIRHAFDRWPSTGHGTEPAPRGARGLWRVARLVRTYRGRITVRSADALAGKVFGEAVLGSEITQDGLDRCPGTLIDVDILTDPHFPQQLAVSWAGWSAGEDNMNLHLVQCTLHPHEGIGDDDRANLISTAQLAGRVSGSNGIVVTVTIPEAGRPLSESATQAVLRHVLDIASLVADPTPVVVVFANADPRILDVSIAGLHTEQARGPSVPEWLGAGNPVLVLGAYGPPQWCGGSVPLRRLLEALNRNHGVLSHDQAQRHWRDAGGDSMAYWRTLRGLPDLFVEVDRQITLRISPESISRILYTATEKSLTETIGSGGPGVDIGRFRTPTLRITNRWIDVDRLVTSTVGVGLAGYVLARKSEGQLRGPDATARPAAVVLAATMPELLASQLSECLSLGGRCYATPGELDLDGVSSHDQMPDGARVVLCADLISTENTVRRAVAAIARTTAEPAVIACLIDARAQHGPITIFNKQIPVVSLCEVDISEPPQPASNSSFTDIDPILWRPVVAPTAQATPLAISEDELLDWCGADRTVLRLGHIKRPPRVHFSAYLRLDRLLHNEIAADRIIIAAASTVTGHLDRWRNGRGENAALDTVQIWHPESEGNYAGMLANRLRDRLLANRFRAVPVRRVPRGVAADRWAFPSTLGNDCQGQPVVIVDWGTVSTTSVQQMIRLAASAGAASIIAITLLNQIPDQDTEVLVGYRAVSGAPGQQAERIVPTAVHFITATSIAGMPAHDCGVCATRERYAVDPEEAPKRLRRHAELLRDMMRTKTREEITHSVAADLFNVPVSGQDVADYLRWRGLLRRALRVTAKREEVLDRLRALVAGEHSIRWSRDNLVRLVAAEQQWLKLPPLRFGEARELLAALCVQNLGSPTASEWLGIQALIVLATTSPEQFVARLPELLAHVVSEPELVDQILLECYQLLRKAPQDTPVAITQLHAGLLRCRDHLDKYSDSNNVAVLRDHRHVLSELVVTAKYRQRSRPHDAQTAWARLQTDLNRVVIEHRLDSEVLRVRDFVDDLQEHPPARQINFDPQDDWNRCTTQLVERVLTNLPPLRQILTSAYVEDRLGQANQQKLFQLTEPNGISALQAVTNLLNELVHEPWLPSEPRWRARRQDLLARLKWWYRMFLATHLPESERPAIFVDLIGSAPVRLAEQVDQILTAHGVAALIDHADLGQHTLVFCPDRLLDQTVGHLLDNAQRHGVPDTERQFHVDYQSVDEQTIQFILHNTNSQPTPVPGNGIRSFNDMLAPFGGSVSGTTTTGKWTFKSTITLSLWQGASNGTNPGSYRR